MNIRCTRRAAIGLLLAAATTSGWAQAYPARPVKVVVPFGPGTAIDLTVRQLNEVLGKSLGQTFVTENRAGAAGTIGAAFVAASPPDGYTLLITATGHTTTPAFMTLPFDPVKDFAGVTTITDSPLVLVAHRSSGFQNLKTLVDAAKAKPGTLSFGSAGVGSSTHMSAEKLRSAAGFEALHVPFKSTTDALHEVLAGRVTYTYTGIASALPFVADGRLVPLAMGGARRSAAFPDVPTVEETGFSDATYPSWLGILVPARTPRDIVMKLNEQIRKALATPEMKAYLDKAGAQAFTTTPEEYDAMIRREVVDNARLVKTLNLKMP